MIREQLARIPKGYRNVFLVSLVAFLLVFLLVNGYGWVKGKIHDRARAAHEADKVKWTAERNQLLGEIKGLRAQLAALEAKDLALGEAAEQGKKLDEATQAKITQLTEDAAHETATINEPTDCHVRADRSRANLARLKPPILVDADEWRRRLCAR